MLCTKVGLAYYSESSTEKQLSGLELNELIDNLNIHSSVLLVEYTALRRNLLISHLIYYDKAGLKHIIPTQLYAHGLALVDTRKVEMNKIISVGAECHPTKTVSGLCYRSR